MEKRVPFLVQVSQMAECYGKMPTEILDYSTENLRIFQLDMKYRKEEHEHKKRTEGVSDQDGGT